VRPQGNDFCDGLELGSVAEGNAIEALGRILVHGRDARTRRGWRSRFAQLTAGDVWGDLIPHEYGVLHALSKAPNGIGVTELGHASFAILVLPVIAGNCRPGRSGSPSTWFARWHRRHHGTTFHSSHVIVRCRSH
jgi:hypothetical protein